MRTPPQAELQPPAGAPLTQHLLIWLVDGLRYDYATNPQIAPNFARHMADDAHALVLADRVTMTSSAVMALGAGRRSGLVQIITNLNAQRTPYNHILSNAKQAGLRTALSGDITWHYMLGDFDQQLFDTDGISIETDNTKEILQAASQQAFQKDRPNLLIAHFLAVDHFGHAYGTTSPKYLALLRQLDDDMQRFFDKLPPDWTVIGMSDHGQTDTGTHGTDTTLTRRAPFFAYGPGIKKGAFLKEIDQVHLASTLATLLGISGPSRAVGTSATELLDVTSEQAASIACSDVLRFDRLANSDRHADLSHQLKESVAACSQPQSPPQARIDAGKKASRIFDDFEQAAKASEAGFSILVILLVLSLTVLVPTWLIRRASRSAFRPVAFPLAAASLMVAVACVQLTQHVEQIPAPWDDITRGVLFGLGFLSMLLGLLVPRLGTGLFSRYPALSLALLPGAIAWSYTTNTPHLALGILIVALLIWYLVPHADLRPVKSLFHGRPHQPWWKALLALGAIVGVFSAGLAHGDPTPSVLVGHPHWQLILGLIAVCGWLLAGARDRDQGFRSADALSGICLAVSSVLLRRVVPSTLGLGALMLFPVLAVLAARYRRFTLALALGFASYAWVSRDSELVLVGCTAFLLETLGQAVRDSSRPQDRAVWFRPWALALLCAAAFSASFLAREGLQGGLDLTNIDYGAGQFGDRVVPEVRSFACAIWKYVAVMVLLFAGLLRALPQPLRRTTALALPVVYAVRAAVLGWMLFACQSSYWTALRTMSDIPTALIGAIAAAGVLWAIEGRKVPEYESEPEPARMPWPQAEASES